MTQPNFFRSRFLGHKRLITLGLFGLLLSSYFCAADPPSFPNSVILMPVPKPQYFAQNGVPLSFGCVFSYQVNSTTPLATFTDINGSVQNTNPVILSAGGTASIWIQAGLSYTIVVKSAGGTNCALGSTLYTVDGIGGGVTVLTTLVTYSATPVFNIAAQIQLFKITLTGDASSQPLTAVGIIPPGIVSWEITQDVAGGHLFTWPANSVGGCTIGPGSNQVTLQHFIWDGATAIATGPCVTGNGPTISAGNIFDYGLTASKVVCTDANKQLDTGCNGGALSSVTYNGQTVAPGGAGNVNAAAAAHSVALNQGDGNKLTGLVLGAHETPIGVAGADPVNKPLPNCPDTAGQHLNFTQSTDAWSCGTTGGGIDQFVSTGGCTASGSPCTVSTNWPVAFADTSYFVLCTPTSEANNSAAIFWVSTKNNGSFVISIDNRGTNAPGGYNSFDCFGHHP